MLKSWAARKKDKHALADSSSSSNSGCGPNGNQNGQSGKVFGVALPSEDLSSLPKGAYNPEHFIDGIPVVFYKTISYLYKHGTSGTL